MDNALLSPEKHSLVSSFLEIAVGQTKETAVQFLQATSWQLDEAIQLFYIGNEGGGGAASSFPAPAEGSSEPTGDVVAKENIVQDVVEDEVRPPLPVKREALYDDAAFYRQRLRLLFKISGY